VTTEVGPVDASPLLSATLLRGQAQSKANAACTTGTDLSYGLGYAANVGLISGVLGSPALSTSAATPDRSVSQSRSHTFLVPQEGASSPIRKFGLASETRQTIAPVTFFKGLPNEFTLEFAGEWVLRTVADGKTGKVHYGPGDVSPSTPLLRVLDKTGAPLASATIKEVTTQMLLGPTFTLIFRSLLWPGLSGPTSFHVTLLLVRVSADGFAESTVHTMPGSAVIVSTTFSFVRTQSLGLVTLTVQVKSSPGPTTFLSVFLRSPMPHSIPPAGTFVAFSM
jgi:hypothetical protein